MSPECLDLPVDSLVSRAHDIDRFLALYRAELTRIPTDVADASSPVRGELEELEDLLHIVEDLWDTVASRTARLHEEIQSRWLAAEVEHEISTQGEKWSRYLAFAAAAGIRVPAPVN